MQTIKWRMNTEVSGIEMACEKAHYEAGVYLKIKSVLRELGIKVIKSNWIYFYSITITFNKELHP